jgi:hypothetical protein
MKANPLAFQQRRCSPREARRIAANIAKLPYCESLSASGVWLLDVVLATRGTDWVNKTRLSRADQRDEQAIAE